MAKELPTKTIQKRRTKNICVFNVIVESYDPGV